MIQIKSRFLKYIILIIISLSLMLVFYINSLKRIEYEHSISIPSKTVIIENESEWWILNSNENERHVKSHLCLPYNDIKFFLKSDWSLYKLINNTVVFEDSTEEELYVDQTFYKGNKNNKNIRHWIKIIKIDNGIVIFELLTTYS